MNNGLNVALAACLGCLALPAQAEVVLDPYLKADTYESIKISPTGAFYAATLTLPDRTVLIILRRSDKQVMARAMGAEHSTIANYWWVNDNRVVTAMAAKRGPRDAPTSTGELHAVNADGTGGKKLIGNVEPSRAGQQATIYGGKYQYAELIDTLPRDDQYALVAMSEFDSNPVTRVVRMNVDSGRFTEVASISLRRASFVADSDGVVRLAFGADRDNNSELRYRDDSESPWRALNEEKTSGHVEWPLGFSADNRTVYLQVQQDKGPDALFAYDTGSGQRTRLPGDAVVDPEWIVRWGSDRAPVGATFASDRRRTVFFDAGSDAEKVQRTLEKAFPDQSVLITSATTDGQLLVVRVTSDANPGDFYLYDQKDKTASLIFSRRASLDPAQSARTRSIELKARDGLALHGFLTLPPGKGEASLPMVVLPHGGPFGITDTADFDEEVQMLAQAGYAVLRINYRGSGGYGRAFLHAGARQWGKAMQDDVSDATRWAVAQKIADPARICIYGASYGAYAAMMALARDPDLFRCGVGYVGVYDLPLMYSEDAAGDRSSRIWLDGWVGAPDTLAAVSPSRLAASITKPVFLAAGGADTRAPIAHSKRMEKALKEAGIVPEVLYFPTEGHGFYTLAHRQEYYVKLFDFLSRHIGGAKAK
jgi:dipeptidyl aminopeptidase/acylaminoacyl peptidase